MSQLLPGAIIGIIGGDEQVASIAREARKMGVRCVLLSPIERSGYFDG